MDAQVPLVMALDDPGAVPGVVGGKGASLARLARAGFRVPPGFCVTTGAYLDFTSRGGMREPVLAAMAAVDVSGAATFGAASARIGELFAGRPVPARSAAAIAGAYACLGDDVPVAVRSSATVEDLPGMSAAGQHDTYLNVRGEAAVLDAVKRCWASLWSARAIGYRARRGVEPGDVSIAVVVQQLVPAEAAGVMFTVDPVGGGHNKVVISANWGLGESVVAGEVTPDVAVVDRASGTLVSYQVGSKETMTVADGTATRAAGTPPGLRSAAVLSPAQAGELARVGLAIEKLYDEPVDVEWALAAGELSVVQARPVTAPASRPAAGPGEQWNDSLDGDYLWSNGNLGEAFPDVMTPATWSFVEVLMSRMTFPPSLPGYRGYGRIGGRFYANVSMSISLEALVGISPRRFAVLLGPVLGKLPPVGEIPRPRLPRWKAIRLTVPAVVVMARRIRASQKRMPEFLASAPGRCDRLRAEIEQTTDPAVLASLWPAKVRPLVEEACDMLAAATAHGITLLSVPGKLATLVGEADSALLLSGQQADGALLASLGPVSGLARLARGEIDRDAFAGRYGHRGSHEVELSIPRPAEDPAWIDGQLAAVGGTARDVGALLAKQEAARAAAWERLARQDPGKARAARKLVARWARVARDREAARSEVARSAWVTRTWVRRAGQLTGHGDDLFFLEMPETFDLLRGDRAPLAKVAARRATYETYRALPPYPALIRGRFDPIRWAADPDRRSDCYDERAQTARPDDTITGFPGAAGVVEGTAHILLTPEDAAQLGDGDVLVTTVTNIGWTLVFPRAAAVVTDVGAPLSHAAIVARELGIPAVVGCGNATMRLHTGDRIRVDGSHGTVEVLHQA
ncbi:MAG TPA: PEP/pyruvate-binding domain-containing protein [Streptosporangiaceae bacterium]